MKAVDKFQKLVVKTFFRCVPAPFFDRMKAAMRKVSTERTKANSIF
jgi:hypothetical protein